MALYRCIEKSEDITPSNTSPATLTANNAVKPTTNGYAIESYTNVTPSASSVNAIAPGAIVKNIGSSTGYLTIPTQVTPSNSSPVSLTSGKIYKTVGSGYAIQSYSSKTPSATGEPFDTGIVKMSSGGYAYSEKPEGREDNKGIAFMDYVSSASYIAYIAPLSSQSKIFELNHYPIYLYHNGSDVTIKVTVNNTTSTITIASPGNYNFYLISWHMLNYNQCLIEYMYDTANGYGSTKYLRLITLKNNGTLYQSSAATLCTATTASTTYQYYFMRNLTDNNNDFITIKMNTTNSNTAMVSYCYNMQIVYPTGELLAGTQSLKTLTASNASSDIYGSKNRNYKKFGYTRGGIGTCRDAGTYKSYLISHSSSANIITDTTVALSEKLCGTLTNGYLVTTKEVQDVGSSTFCYEINIIKCDLTTPDFITKKTIQSSYTALASNQEFKIIAVINNVIIVKIQGNKNLTILGKTISSRDAGIYRIKINIENDNNITAHFLPDFVETHINDAEYMTTANIGPYSDPFNRVYIYDMPDSD